MPCNLKQVKIIQSATAKNTDSDIVVENANSVKSIDLVAPVDSTLLASLSKVAPRIITENANSIQAIDLTTSLDSNLLVSASMVTPRIITENANSIIFANMLTPFVIYPPSSPSNLQAVISPNSIILTWSPSVQGTYQIGGYAIYRGTSQGNESPTPIATVSGNTTTYTDTNVSQQITYYYYVKAFDNQNPPNYSQPSNEISAKIETFTITATAGQGGTIYPSGSVSVVSGSSQTFTITPNVGYKIKDVKVDGASVGAVNTYTFTNVTSNHTIEVTFEVITYTINASSSIGGSISPSGLITVNYGDSKTFTIIPNSGYKISDVKVDGKSMGPVSTYTFTNITSNHTIEAVFVKQSTQIVIVLKIGSTTFTVNGSTKTLDSPPIIKNGRTLLPIRPVVEALGGTVSWDPTEKKVNISLGSTTIELWIGNNTARVNGVSKPIDSINSKVVPEIINGRTMLPLRFVTENLGCQLQWDPNTQTITITYQG
jgi:hypothetical protein